MERKLRLVHRKEANLSHAAMAFLQAVKEYADTTGGAYCYVPERAE
jgi:hypothetical protein